MKLTMPRGLRKSRYNIGATDMIKARYIRKEPNGKGGWDYVYHDKANKKKINPTFDESRPSHKDVKSAHKKNHTIHHGAMEASARSERTGKHSDHLIAKKMHESATTHFSADHKEWNRKAEEVKPGGARDFAIFRASAKASKFMAEHHNEMKDHHERVAGAMNPGETTKSIADWIGDQFAKAMDSMGLDPDDMSKSMYTQKVPDGKGGWKYIYGAGVKVSKHLHKRGEKARHASIVAESGTGNEAWDKHLHSNAHASHKEAMEHAKKEGGKHTAKLKEATDRKKRVGKLLYDKKKEQLDSTIKDLREKHSAHADLVKHHREKMKEHKEKAGGKLSKPGPRVTITSKSIGDRMLERTFAKALGVEKVGDHYVYADHRKKDDNGGGLKSVEAEYGGVGSVYRDAMWASKHAIRMSEKAVECSNKSRWTRGGNTQDSQEASILHGKSAAAHYSAAKTHEDAIKSHQKYAESEKAESKKKKMCEDAIAYHQKHQKLHEKVAANHKTYSEGHLNAATQNLEAVGV